MSAQPFANIRIVLVNTSHPGNIGGAARAMKNMGLSRLYLVAPQEYPSDKAVWRSAGATDVLDDAVMPAVDYRLAGGLSWEELTRVLRVAVQSGRAVGLEVTIYNPQLDDDGSGARGLVSAIAAALA